MVNRGAYYIFTSSKHLSIMVSNPPSDERNMYYSLQCTHHIDKLQTFNIICLQNLPSGLWKNLLIARPRFTNFITFIYHFFSSSFFNTLYPFFFFFHNNTASLVLLYVCLSKHTYILTAHDLFTLMGVIQYSDKSVSQIFCSRRQIAELTQGSSRRRSEGER